jgi:hypothetical protein
MNNGENGANQEIYPRYHTRSNFLTTFTVRVQGIIHSVTIHSFTNHHKALSFGCIPSIAHALQQILGKCHQI